MELYRNSVNDIEFRFYVGRVLTDVDAVPTVALKLNGVALPSRTVSQVADGVYSAQLLYADTFEEGELEAKWTFTYLGSTSEKIEYHTVVTPYVDLGYLYELNETDEDIYWAEIFSRYQIDRFTGQKFGLRKGWIKASGNDTSYLILPEHTESITNLYEGNLEVWNNVDQFEVDVQVCKSGFALHSFSGEYDVAMFKSGKQYEAWGQFGYKRVPDDVSSCAKMLVDDFLCHDRSWREKYVKKLSNGDWGVEFDGRVFSGTGNSIVDAILSDYVWHRMIVI